MTEKEQLLEDIKEMLKIPAIYKYFLYKTDELKYVFADNIDNYREIRSLLDNEKKPRISNGEKFIIFRGGNEWQSPIDIPRQILDYIGSLKLKTGTPTLKRNLRFPGLNEKVYDLLLERLDEDNISVIMHANAGPTGEKNETSPSPKPVDEELNEFIGYLATNKTFLEYVLAQFRCKWKYALASQVKKIS